MDDQGKPEHNNRSDLTSCLSLIKLNNVAIMIFANKKQLHSAVHEIDSRHLSNNRFSYRQQKVQKRVHFMVLQRQTLRMYGMSVI